MKYCNCCWTHGVVDVAAAAADDYVDYYDYYFVAGDGLASHDVALALADVEYDAVSVVDDLNVDADVAYMRQQFQLLHHSQFHFRFQQPMQLHIDYYLYCYCYYCYCYYYYIYWQHVDEYERHVAIVNCDY